MAAKIKMSVANSRGIETQDIFMLKQLLEEEEIE